MHPASDQKERQEHHATGEKEHPERVRAFTIDKPRTTPSYDQGHQATGQKPRRNLHRGFRFFVRFFGSFFCMVAGSHGRADSAHKIFVSFFPVPRPRRGVGREPCRGRSSAAVPYFKPDVSPSIQIGREDAWESVGSQSLLSVASATRRLDEISHSSQFTEQFPCTVVTP
jgi:hypothetical protein